MGEADAYLTRDGISLMIKDAIEVYDTKVSAPRHAENQKEMKSATVKLGELFTVLSKIEGAISAFKVIGYITASAWTVTQLGRTALAVVEALHKQ